MIKSVGARELKTRLGHYLREVRGGHTIVVTDRGEIADGKRADLIRVRVAGDSPAVRSVWREGRRVA